HSSHTWHGPPQSTSVSRPLHIPSVQVGIVHQIVHPSRSLSLPSSHCSPSPISPSPQPSGGPVSDPGSLDPLPASAVPPSLSPEPSAVPSAELVDVAPGPDVAVPSSPRPV